MCCSHAALQLLLPSALVAAATTSCQSTVNCKGTKPNYATGVSCFSAVHLSDILEPTLCKQSSCWFLISGGCKDPTNFHSSHLTASFPANVVGRVLAGDARRRMKISSAHFDRAKAQELLRAVSQCFDSCRCHGHVIFAVAGPAWSQILVLAGGVCCSDRPASDRACSDSRDCLCLCHFVSAKGLGRLAEELAHSSTGL